MMVSLLSSQKEEYRQLVARLAKLMDEQFLNEHIKINISNLIIFLVNNELVLMPNYKTLLCSIYNTLINKV